MPEQPRRPAGVTPTEAARILGVSERTVSRWAARGRLRIVWRSSEARNAPRRYSLDDVTRLRREQNGKGAA